MNKKIKSLLLTVFMGCMLASPAFADYAEVNVFNRFTDWCFTIGRHDDERHRIIDQRIAERARWREEREHRFHERHEDQRDDHRGDRRDDYRDNHRDDHRDDHR